MTKLLALATALTLTFVSSIHPAEAGMRVGFGIGVGALAIGAIAHEAHRSEAREYHERTKARTARRHHDEDDSSTRTAKKSKQKSDDTDKETVATSEASSIASGAAPAVTAVTTTGSITALAETENSSITLTPVSTAPAVKKIDTASQGTKGLDCRKFFPSVAMTLSVPCE